jgi:hypothetical protein
MCPKTVHGSRALPRTVLHDLNFKYLFVRWIATQSLHQGRTETAPGRGLLIGMGDAEGCCFIERPADDLHGEGQAGPIKSSTDGNRRVAGHVEDRGKVWPLKKMGRFVRAYFRRWPLGAKRHHGIIARE